MDLKNNITLYKLMDYESNEMITIRFPIDNKTFINFNNRSLDDQETIIKLGTPLLKLGKDRKLTMNNEEWERKANELRSELREMVETYEKKMKNLKKQMNEIKENFLIQKRDFFNFDTLTTESLNNEITPAFFYPKLYFAEASTKALCVNPECGDKEWDRLICTERGARVKFWPLHPELTVAGTLVLV